MLGCSVSIGVAPLAEPAGSHRNPTNLETHAVSSSKLAISALVPQREPRRDDPSRARRSGQGSSLRSLVRDPRYYSGRRLRWTLRTVHSYVRSSRSQRMGHERRRVKVCARNIRSSCDVVTWPCCRCVSPQLLSSLHNISAFTFPSDVQKLRGSEGRA